MMGSDGAELDRMIEEEKTRSFRARRPSVSPFRGKRVDTARSKTPTPRHNIPQPVKSKGIIHYSL